MTDQSPLPDADLGALLIWMREHGTRVQLEYDARTAPVTPLWACTWQYQGTSYTVAEATPEAACRSVLRVTGILPRE